MRETVVRVVIILVSLAGEWYLYCKLLSRIMDRHWVRPTQMNRIVVFGMPALFGVFFGLLFHSWLVGLLFLTPLVIPFIPIGGFLILWACEQWSIRRLLR